MPSFAFLALLLAAPVHAPRQELTPAEARALAKEAYVYGFPLVDNYRVLHSYSVDTKHPEYKGPWNHLTSVGRVFTPEDKAIQTPNSDTPYSMLAFDLRSEPLVLTLPAIEAERYYSVLFIDAYTHNFDYVGSRTTGNGGGSFLIAGPDWKGETPKGITRVLHCETQFGLALFRTQLLRPDDIENVRKLQASYRVEPLSSFLGQPAPKAAAALAYPAPLAPEAQKTSLTFFELFDWVLQSCPTHPSERELRGRFARAGLGSGTFRAASLAPELRAAFEQGMADAWVRFGELSADFAAGKLTSGMCFGTREFLENDYEKRFFAAVVGLYGNSADEALYPSYRVDAAGEPLDGAKFRYTLRFPPGGLPPVNAFWSATLYELPASLLYANPLARYLINSPMLPDLKLDADGGLTLHIQHASPGQERESNWLPAPSGPFWIALRLYWPKPAALAGEWKQPPLLREPR